jgi:hypothetical protein
VTDHDTILQLRDSLLKLSNEASGFLAMADRNTHGNTNMAVLKMRIDDARALLETTKPQEEDDPCKMTDSQYEEYLYGPNRAKWPTNADEAK